MTEAGRRPRILLYGANGYTGRLIAEAAGARGLPLTLAGRNAEAVAALGREAGLPWLALGLDEPAALRRATAAHSVVLHCAGPFSATAAPMMAACLDTGTHYLDITGEIAVFEHARAQHAAACAAGILLCPGVGFDVVPTDCMAAALHAALPDACSLELAFASRSPGSPGTTQTSIEALQQGGKRRRGGRLETVPLGWGRREIDFDGQRRTVVAIPWGDLATAYYSTGIPDITVFMAVPPRLARLLGVAAMLRPLLARPAVQAWLKQRAARMAGPDTETRARTGTRLWGRVCNPGGQQVVAHLTTANGYALTVDSALACAAALLDRPAITPGYATPSQAFGADWIARIAGGGIIRLSPPGPLS